MNHYPRPAKMLICFMGRHRGEFLVEAAKRAGARGGTIALGKSIGNNRFLRALSLADILQDIVFIVMTDEADATLKAIRKAALRDRKRLQGAAALIRAPELFLRAPPEPSGAVNSQAEPRRSGKMESGYKLISVIVNSGYAEDVMAAARKAGASGGTIINARGTGTEDDVKFFGITLVPEKEMLLIVAERDKVDGIHEAISGVPTLAEPGGGIFYSVNVEKFILLGQQKPWPAEDARATPPNRPTA